jgi:hypothetical protein
MTTKPLLPQTFWFRFAAQCQRIEEIPRIKDPSRLLDLPATCAVPDLNQLEGAADWAKVYLAWNPRGVGIAILADGVSSPQLNSDRAEGFAAVDLWIDTRDSRNVSRATKFCHHFQVSLKLSMSRKELTVEIRQRPIPRATADAPMGQMQMISTRAKLDRAGWQLELFFPAQVLHGFDPETNRRLGFTYLLRDHIHDSQYFAGGREFPIGENPGLWSTIELRD